MQPIFSFFIQLANCSVKKKQKKYQFCESNLKISLFKICKLKIISNEKTIFKLLNSVAKKFVAGFLFLNININKKMKF